MEIFKSLPSDQIKIIRELIEIKLLRKLTDLENKFNQSTILNTYPRETTVSITTTSTTPVVVPVFNWGNLPNDLYWGMVYITGKNLVTSDLYGGIFTGMALVDNKTIASGAGAWRLGPAEAENGASFDFGASGSYNTVTIIPASNDPTKWRIKVEIK